MTFKELVKFLSHEEKVLNQPIFGYIKDQQSKSNEKMLDGKNWKFLSATTKTCEQRENAEESDHKLLNESENEKVRNIPANNVLRFCFFL